MDGIEHDWWLIGGERGRIFPYFSDMNILGRVGGNGRNDIGPEREKICWCTRFEGIDRMGRLISRVRGW